MRVLLLPIYFAVALVFSGEATAIGSECDSPKEGSTLQESCLLQRELQEQNQRLNSIHKELLLRWSTASFKNEREGLINAQRTWINYRDKTCSFEQAVRGGIISISYSRCVARLTYERVEYLKGIDQ